MLVAIESYDFAQSRIEKVFNSISAPANKRDQYSHFEIGHIDLRFPSHKRYLIPGTCPSAVRRATAVLPAKGPKIHPSLKMPAKRALQCKVRLQRRTRVIRPSRHLKPKHPIAIAPITRRPITQLSIPQP